MTIFVVKCHGKYIQASIKRKIMNYLVLPTRVKYIMNIEISDNVKLLVPVLLINSNEIINVKVQSESYVIFFHSEFLSRYLLQ